MRGKARSQREMVCLLNLEERIPAGHPIREVKAMVGEVLRELGSLFEEMYAANGRPSIPPERLLAGKVLQALYSVRSDRQFCERLRYDLLFQWFLDMNPDEPAFHASSWSKNAERLLGHQVADAFFFEVVELARRRGWTSNEHFSVDGTLIEAWGSLKSFRRKDEVDTGDGPGGGSNGWVDFKGQKRSNQTHESRTDPEARLMRKGNGKEAKLSFGAHALMENRNGLCVLIDVRPACGAGSSEGEAALDQMEEALLRGFGPRTVGADRGYHNRPFVRGCRQMEIAPHAAEVRGRRVAGMDKRTTRHAGYRHSQRIRKRIEEIFGWMKTTGLMRRSRYFGLARTRLQTLWVAGACNLIRMAKLAQAPPATA